MVRLFSPRDWVRSEGSSRAGEPRPPDLRPRSPTDRQAWRSALSCTCARARSPRVRPNFVGRTRPGYNVDDPNTGTYTSKLTVHASGIYEPCCLLWPFPASSANKNGIISVRRHSPSPGAYDSTKHYVFSCCLSTPMPYSTNRKTTSNLAMAMSSLPDLHP